MSSVGIRLYCWKEDKKKELQELKDKRRELKDTAAYNQLRYLNGRIQEIEELIDFLECMYNDLEEKGGN